MFSIEEEAQLLRFNKTMWNGTQSLRVGVVQGRDQPSPWVQTLLSFLKQIPGIDVHLFTISILGLAELKRPPWLVDRLYSISRARFDPFGDLSIDVTDSVAPEFVDAIRAAHCGVIIWLADYQGSDIELRGLAEHGILTVRLGDRNRAIPFWDEVANCDITSTVTIFWHDSAFAQGRAVRKAETATSPELFVTKNAEQPLVATIRMLAALCLEIQHGGATFQKERLGLAPQLLENAAQRNCPSNFDAARFIVKKLARSAHLRWTAHGKTPKWFVALRPNRGNAITDPARRDLSGFRDVPLPRGVEAMADPFLWEVNGRQFLLFEEIAVGQSRGRLACIEVLPDGGYSEMRIILERPYHLSYPCIVPSNGDLFLLPETAATNRVDLYRFRRFPAEVELVSSPVEGVPLLDTTPVFVDDRWYFFASTTEPFMETLLFSAAQLEGPWSLHPRNPVSTSVRSCRSAGHLFWRSGRLYRPTQDCSVRYGYAMAVNEVTKLTPTEFEEQLAYHIPPSWAAGLVGTHTWNESSRFQVLDGRRMVNRSGAPQLT